MDAPWKSCWWRSWLVEILHGWGVAFQDLKKSCPSCFVLFLCMHTEAKGREWGSKCVSVCTKVKAAVEESGMAAHGFGTLHIGLNFEWPAPAEGHGVRSDFFNVDKLFKKVFQAKQTQFKSPEITNFQFVPLGGVTKVAVPALCGSLAEGVKYPVGVKRLFTAKTCQRKAIKPKLLAGL